MKQNVIVGAVVAVAAIGIIAIASQKKSDDGMKPSPSPSVSVSGAPAASPTASPKVSPTRTPVKTPTPTAMPSSTPTATPTPTTTTISFEKSAYSVDEDEGPVVLTVVRTGNLSGTSTADYEASAGSAGSDDYAPSHGTLTFAPGVSSLTIPVGITDDQTAESDETFTYMLSNGARTTVTIHDDESNQ